MDKCENAYRNFDAHFYNFAIPFYFFVQYPEEYSVANRLRFVQ